LIAKIGIKCQVWLCSRSPVAAIGLVLYSQHPAISPPKLPDTGPVFHIFVSYDK